MNNGLQMASLAIPDSLAPYDFAMEAPKSHSSYSRDGSRYAGLVQYELSLVVDHHIRRSDIHLPFV